MRITYRNRKNKDYWNTRWNQIPADEPMSNISAYPLKYSEMIIKNNHENILEAGCGNGRILRYYHNKGHKIIGFDFIDIAIKKLKDIDSTLKVEVGDITELRFKDNSFDRVLAFGLYHNLDKGLNKSIYETYRILKENGLVCASFRADNIQTRLTDWLASKKSESYDKNQKKIFHKLNLTKKEFSDLFKKNGFKIEKIFPVENMPLLYKFRFFRKNSHKKFNENMSRKEGYKLSFLGNFFQKALMKLFPNQFCNIYVIIAKK